MRVLAEVSDGHLLLLSRNGNDVTVSFPELSFLAGTGRPEDMLVDGEVVALDAGVPSFSILAERMHVSDARKALRLAVTHPVTFMAFDLLRLDGVDLTPRPLSERRASLERIGLAGPNCQVPPTYDDGDALRAATLEHGLEGVVSKRLSSRYSPGRRSPHWLKFPNRESISVVVGGWRLETGSTSRLGAVLVGRAGPGGLGGLEYLGRVGSGLAGKAQVALLDALRSKGIDASPFADDVPRMDSEGTFWVRPEVVVDVQALGLTPQGRLRQPAYRGLRPDLSPGDLYNEE